MSRVEFQSVFKQLGTTEVLKGIDLKLPANRITAVVGESGSGKSTLLEHINGLLKPDSGKVRVAGVDLDYADLTSVRRTIGYAVQGIGLFPHLTVTQNISLLARIEGWLPSRIAARRGELMDMMELPAGLGERYPSGLSGGQQQRVGICRALMLKPKLILLDEAFSGVDPITRRAIHEEFLRLQSAEEITVVLVTHDMSEARHLAHYLVVLKDGRVAQADSLAAVVAAPGSDYVAGLFASGAQGS